MACCDNRRCMTTGSVQWRSHTRGPCLNWRQHMYKKWRDCARKRKSCCSPKPLILKQVYVKLSCIIHCIVRCVAVLYVYIHVYIYCMYDVRCVHILYVFFKATGCLILSIYPNFCFCIYFKTSCSCHWHLHNGDGTCVQHCLYRVLLGYNASIFAALRCK